MTAGVRIYADTNVVLDYVDRRRANPNSLFLFEQVRARGELSAVISAFTLMEAVEKRQENFHLSWLLNNGYSPHEILGHLSRHRRLSASECAREYDEVYRALSGIGKKLEFHTPAGPEVWVEAAELVRKTNISAPDSIHVAVARSASCSIFATSDADLLRELSATPRLRRSLIPLDCNKEIRPRKFEKSLNSAVRRVRSRPPTLKGVKSAIVVKRHPFRAVVKIVEGFASEAAASPSNVASEPTVESQRS